MDRVPWIVSQSSRYLQLAVPSKSEPGTFRTVEYKPNGDRECSCPGAYWFKEKGQDLYKLCRHQKMTTIEVDSNWPYDRLLDARKTIGYKRSPLYVVWAMVGCQFPEHREENKIHCTGCPLYPKVCNIRKIKYGRGPGARLPLIWRLQTACYTHERGKAKKLINQIINEIKSISSARPGSLKTPLAEREE